MQRKILATLLCTASMISASVVPAFPEPMIGYNLNTFGLPGAIDTPSAEVLPDATLGAVVNTSDLGRRTMITAQVTPQITGVLRYSRIKGFDSKRDALWDRSFDFHFQAFGEDADGWRPAVAIGLRDFMGTGVYSGEYIVATKTLTPSVRASVGLGWGRLAGKIRDQGRGGNPHPDKWFSGDPKPFASVDWQVNDKLNFAAEYSNDRYLKEVREGGEQPKGRVNVGLRYRMNESYELSAYNLGGNIWGLQFALVMNPRKSPFPSGLEQAGAPVRPRPDRAADPEGWSGAWTAEPTARPVIQKALADALAKDGQELESMSLTADRAEIRIRNKRYIQQAEAVGRATRLMTRALPPSVETLVVTSVAGGMPTSSVVMRRSDVERLENTEAGQIASAAQLIDADPRPAGLVPTPGVLPRFQWSLTPYVETGFFDPDQPLRYEAGGQLSARYELLPGLVAKGTLRQRLFGNADQKAPGNMTVAEYKALTPAEQTAGNNGVPRVRSDARMYSGNTSVQVPELTLAWYAKPTETVYSRVTVGLLEPMYGGVSAEVLWKPVQSPLALGAEINRVKKRDYRNAFEFLDYEATTGHVSAYYEFGGGYVGQIDAGKYLAGDVGATVTLKREFANGWMIGAYATKTDMSADKFGEGSFDKGIMFSAPVSWALGTPSRKTVGGKLGSLNRDGGQRVNIDGRLYETIRDTQAGPMYDGWGRFWR